MEITLPVAELKAALPGFSKVVGKSRTLPVLNSLKVQRNPQGIVTLEATDLDAHLSYQLKGIQPGAPLSMIVPLDTLSKCVKGSTDTLTLIPDGTDKVRLRHCIGNSPVEQRISTAELKEWPQTPKVIAAPVALDKNFGPSLKEALQCSSVDSSRAILNGVHVDVSDRKAHYLIGTNGKVLYSANSFCFDLKQSLTIPNLKFLGWSGFPGEDCRLAVDDKEPWLQLQSGPWTLTARQVEGVYPNWRKVIPATARGTTLKLGPEAIAQLLKVVPQLPGGESANFGVRLRIGGGVFIEGRNKDDREWTSIAVPDVTIDGKPVQICLNRHFLIQALRYGLNEVTIQNELAPLVFTQAGRRLVVMPLRPESDTPATPSAPVATQTAEPQTKEEQMPKEEAKAETPTLQTVLTRIEALRDTLKTAARELGDVIDALKAADKEQRSVQREFDSLRAKLRSLQNINL
jgi:DNA polymerase III sliding clamp (beta) subunit (PCNA family)